MSTYRIGLLARLEGPPKEGRQKDSYLGERPYLPSGINVGGNVIEIQNSILGSY